MTSVPTRPPTRAERSRTRTCRPDSSSARAQASPATPAPITATSVASMAGEYHRVDGAAHAREIRDTSWYGPRRWRCVRVGSDVLSRPVDRTRRCARRPLVPRGWAAGGRRGSDRARRRTPTASPRPRPARRARRNRAGGDRGCRTSISAGWQPGQVARPGLTRGSASASGSSEPAQNEA